MSAPLPLSGLTVLDLTTQIPGPYCSMTLADLGARIIKIEPPSGDPLREFASIFDSVNRGKHSLCLNLKSADGRQVLQKLTEKSDIVLEGFRPGVADRLGAGYQSLRKHKSDLVYCSISGFGQTGPNRNRSGHDLNYIAIGGLLGLSETDGGRPVPPPVLISDLASGMYASIAVLAAIRGRDRTGQGQFIDLSMTDAVASWMAPEVSIAHRSESEPQGPFLSGLPHYRVFKTSDDKYLSIGIVYEPHFWTQLCEALGMQEWSDWSTERRQRSAEVISERLDQIIGARSLEDWTNVMLEYDVPCGAVNTLDGLDSDPQFKERDTFRDIRKSDGQVTRQVMPPFRFPDVSVGSSEPPPGPGEHSTEILNEIGYTEEQIEDLRQAGVVGL